MHSVEGASTGSPREILQLGYKIGFINDSEVWLLMLKKRNTSVRIYNEDEIDEICPNGIHCADDIKEFGWMFAMHDNRCI